MRLLSNLRPCRRWNSSFYRASLTLLLLGAPAALLVCLATHLTCGSRSMIGRLPVDDDAGAPASVCHSPRCLEAFEANRQQQQPLRVPPIRHVLWKSRQVSGYFARQLKTWARIHPDWKYVLWRDSDLEKFVAKHYSGLFNKFQSLPHYIMRIDMIRYLILYHFGGVYADLDYTLVRSLDRFRKFPAIVTRESEAHSLLHFGMREYPPPVLASPAFLMSEPRHQFFAFCASQLATRPSADYMNFAGPLGLSDLLLKYSAAFPVAVSANLAVYVPASWSFYPYTGNNMSTSASHHQPVIRALLRRGCASYWRSRHPNLTAYCGDILNLNAITDAREPVYAVHDNMKSLSSYDQQGSPSFYSNLVDIGTALPNIVMADSLY